MQKTNHYNPSNELISKDSKIIPPMIANLRSRLEEVDDIRIPGVDRLSRRNMESIAVLPNLKFGGVEDSNLVNKPTSMSLKNDLYRFKDINDESHAQIMPINRPSSSIRNRLVFNSSRRGPPHIMRPLLSNTQILELRRQRCFQKSERIAQKIENDFIRPISLIKSVKNWNELDLKTLKKKYITWSWIILQIFLFSNLAFCIFQNNLSYLYMTMIASPIILLFITFIKAKNKKRLDFSFEKSQIFIPILYLILSILISFCDVITNWSVARDISLVIYGLVFLTDILMRQKQLSITRDVSNSFFKAVILIFSVQKF